MVVILNFEQLELMYFQNNSPVIYNLKSGGTISIHPIKVEDWNIFYSSLSVFMIEKIDANDLNVLKLSYIDFLQFLIKQNSSYMSMIYNVLSQ